VNRRGWLKSTEVGLGVSAGSMSGYEAPHSGGLGGVPDERRYWLRVDDSGFARLDDLRICEVRSYQL